MTTYDNLNIAQATLIFDENGSTAVGAGEFDLSSMAFLPNVPLIDQIEVERVFDTGADTKFGENIFTIADRRQMFIFPKNWYTINEQTKILKFVDLSTIPIGTDQAVPVYYPLSRGYFLVLDNGDTDYITIPVVQNTTTSGPPVRQYDKVFIRRKTPSINSIVTFAPGTRLTTTQLNLQFDQLKYLVQEIVAKLRNEVILKYDENAVDGPFLGNGDLKMGNNFIKDVGSKEITDTATFFTGQDNIAYSGGTFTANVLSVKNAVTKGSLYRTGLVAGTPTFTGDFTTRLPDSATNYKITNLAPGTASTDAVNVSQLNNADNLTAGTVVVARLPLNIPLANLSSAVGQTYTLPLENLPSSLTTAAGSFGASTASNTGNMLSGNVNSKGVLTSLASRNMTAADLPAVSGLTDTQYGGTGKLLTLTTDTKGRITAISAAAITTSDLPNTAVVASSYGAISGTGTNVLTRFTVDGKGNLTAAGHRSIEVNDLPTDSVTGANTYGQSTASNTNNMVRLQYDTKGRVLSASHRNMEIADLPSSIPLTKLSASASQGYTLPSDAIANGSILFAKLDTTTAGQGTLPLAFIPTNIPLNSIDSTVFNTFSLPNGCLANTGTAGTFGDTQPALTIITDTKGRVTSITPRALLTTDIPNLDTSKITTGTFLAARIPTSVVTDNAVYWDSGNSVFTALRSSTRTKVRGVATPTDVSDAVPLDYFTANALVASGGVITASGSRLTGLGTPTPGTAIGSDAVNFALLESVVLSNAQASGQLVGSTLPQVYRSAAPTPTANNPTTGWNRYSFAFVDGTNPLYATTSTMVIVEIEGSSVKCVPQTAAPTAGTVFNGWFYLDISGATKTVYLYTNSSITGTNVIIRNFGLSRLVSGAAATTASAGLVSIFDGTEGGIAVTGLGAISLKPASSTQIGGIKTGTGLVMSGSTAAVDLSDSTTLDSSAKVATSKAVKTLSDTSMLLTGTQQMTGKLSLATPTSGRANILLPSASLDPTTLVDGDLWHNNGILKFRSSATTKTIAFLGDNVATASTLQTARSIGFTGVITGSASFNGSQDISISTSPVANSITLGTHTVGDYVAAITATTGLTLTGTAGEGTTFGLTNSDRGSSQLIYGTVALTGTTTGDASIAAASNTQTLTLNAGTGVSLAGNNATKTITITNTAASPNTFGSIAVATQSTVAADTSADTVTFVAGTGMSITTDAGAADSVTFNNTGVTSVAGTANQVTVTGTTTPTLSLPQNIHSAATPTFAGATLGSIQIASGAANTITTTGTNQALILDPNGTGVITLAGNVSCSTNTLTAGACTFGTLLCDAITFNNNGTKLKLGTTASTVEATIGTVASVSNPGDIVLRVPASGKAFLIAHATDAPTAGTALITKTALDTAVSSAISGGNLMPTAGTVHTAAQTLGCTVGEFNIQTGSTPTNRLTIVNGGAATFSGALTVTGGTTLSDTLVVTGTTTLNNSVTVNSLYNVTSAKAPTTGNHLANKTYVDAQVITATPKCQLHWSYTSPTLTTLKSVGCSVVRTALGVYTVTFSPAIAVPYVVSLSFNYDSTPSYGGGASCPVAQYTDLSTAGFIIRTGTYGQGGAAQDFANVSVIVY